MKTFTRASYLRSHERTHLDEQKKNKFLNQLQRSVFVYALMNTIFSALVVNC